MDGLLELLVVEDGPHLPVAVGAPEGGHYLHLGVAHVHPEHGHHVVIRIKLCSQLIEKMSWQLSSIDKAERTHTSP